MTIKIGSRVTHLDIKNCYGEVTRITDDGKLVVNVGGRLGSVCGDATRWRCDRA